MIAFETNDASLILKIFNSLADLHGSLDFLEEEDNQGKNIFYYLSLASQHMLFIFFLKKFIYWKRENEVEDFNFPFGSFEKSN
jgi:hypothetical protein